MNFSAEDTIFLWFLLFPLVAGALLIWFARRIKRSGRKPGWRAVLAGNSLILLFLVSVLFISGEAYYRFFYDATEALGYTKSTERWMNRYYRQNVAECRDNIQYYARIQSGKRRVTFLGDSFAAGHGIKNVDDRFANRLRHAHPEWEVHALARPGYDTSHEINLMQASLDGNYEADEVVLVYCLNDVSDLLPEWYENLRRIFYDVNRTGWWVRNSYLVNTLYFRIKAAQDPYMRNYYDFVLDAYRGAVWEQQKQRLLALRDLVQSHGGHFTVVTFPFLHKLGPNYEYRFVHEELDRFWRELDVPHLDLLSVYQDLPPATITLNRFDAHPNEYANVLATTAIEKFLQQQMRKETNAAGR